MREILLLIWASVIPLFSQGQAEGDLGKIALSIMMPDNENEFDAGLLAKLESKIIQIVSAQGLAAVAYDHNFIIYPRLSLSEEDKVEGGMQSISVVSADLGLFIKQVEGNLIFSSLSVKLKGSGRDRQSALSNAVSKISVQDPVFKTFLEKGKSEIIRYYANKCQDIILKSERFVKMQQFEQAFGLLMTVPEEVSSCYSRIQEKAIEAYKAYQTQKCSEIIQKAKTTLAANDYVGALNILSELDPSASCFKEAQALANSAAAKVDVEEKKNWDFKMRQYKDAVSLERQRIQAVREIAVAYYKRQTRVNHVHYIIR